MQTIKVFTVIICSLMLNTILSCKAQTNSITKNDDTAIDKEMSALVKHVIVPVFKDKTYNVSNYGAVAGGVKDNTAAFAKVINECSAAGGGKVVVPKGQYLTGPIHLKSGVNLHLEEGCEILFITDPKAYLPLVHTSYEGNEFMNYSPLIYAYKQENVAVTGKGILNGQADNNNWWPWSGFKDYGYKGGPQHKDAHNKDRLMNFGKNGTPVDQRIFGEGYQFRVPFFETVECKNILVQGVTFINAPFWIIHPFKSQHITIDGVTVRSHGPNNDGCDPEYCSYVRIANSIFDTGDDCIAIKSGRNEDGRRVNIPSENIIIEDCIMKDGHGGVVIGSEISAGVRNVYVRNCKMDSPNLDRAIRIKSNTIRGGFVHNVYVTNIEIGQVKECVLRINTSYGVYDEPQGTFYPDIKNIVLSNIKVKNGGKYALFVDGRKELPVKNVTFKNVTIDKVQEPFKIDNIESLKFNNTYINGKLYND
jgi:polygalacturonase